MTFDTYKGRTLVQMKIRANEQNADIERLRASLRKHVICNHYMPNKSGDEVTGHSCDECSAVWSADGPEQHKPSCLAAIPPS